VKGLEDLTRPALKGRITMARPTAGTTGGHVAAMYVLWGDEKADDYFRRLRANGVRLVGGNAIVTAQVGKGALWAGMTDNDDVAATEAEGGRLRMVLPDQNTFGTLTIPTTVGLIQGARNPDAARQLIDYLLTEEVERQLIETKFAAFSVRDDEQKIRPMDVDYAEVARKLPEAVRRSTAILDGR
jgi:iron(III) transport system substrate-binding protein